jgi:outer membrane protein W
MSSIARAARGMMVLGCAFVPAIAAAQKAGDITVGVMAGVNYSKVSSDPEPTDLTLDYKWGLVAGGFAGIQMNDVFSVELQALFSQKGTKVTGTGSNSSASGKVKVNYIEVPLLGKFWIPVSDSQIRPFVFAGPYAAFKVGCTVEGAAFSGSGTDCDQSTEINLKSTDFGVTGGAGLEFKAGAQVVRVDARYSLGLTDINDTSGSDNTKIKNRAFAATVGIGFPLPR